MKYFENLDPLERTKMELRAVAVDSYMEGMDTAKNECLKQLRELENTPVLSTILGPADQKAG